MSHPTWSIDQYQRLIIKLFNKSDSEEEMEEFRESSGKVIINETKKNGKALECQDIT